MSGHHLPGSSHDLAGWGAALLLFCVQYVQQGHVADLVPWQAVKPNYATLVVLCLRGCCCQLVMWAGRSCCNMSLLRATCLSLTLLPLRSLSRPSGSGIPPGYCAHASGCVQQHRVCRHMGNCLTSMAHRGLHCLLQGHCAIHGDGGGQAGRSMGLSVNVGVCVLTKGAGCSWLAIQHARQELAKALSHLSVAASVIHKANVHVWNEAQTARTHQRSNVGWRVPTALLLLPPPHLQCGILPYAGVDICLFELLKDQMLER